MSPSKGQPEGGIFLLFFFLFASKCWGKDKSGIESSEHSHPEPEIKVTQINLRPPCVVGALSFLWFLYRLSAQQEAVLPLCPPPQVLGPKSGGPGDFLHLPLPHLFVPEAIQGGSCQQDQPERESNAQWVYYLIAEGGTAFFFFLIAAPY